MQGCTARRHAPAAGLTWLLACAASFGCSTEAGHAATPPSVGRTAEMSAAPTTIAAAAGIEPENQEVAGEQASGDGATHDGGALESTDADNMGLSDIDLGDGGAAVSPEPFSGAGVDVDGSDGGVSFARDVYERVIRVSCASCHNDGPSFGGLALFPDGPAAAYANLVGIPAGQEENYLCRDSGLLRVKPGDPEHSLLYLKLTNPSCGNIMPPAGLGGAVTSEQLSLVRTWIESGAAP